MNFLKKHWWCVLYGVVLAAFTVYISLDTFVIERATDIPTDKVSFRPSSSQNENSSSFSSEIHQSGTDNNSEPELPPEPMEPVITENSYLDDNISITISQRRVNETECYIADVKLSSAEYLKTAFAKGKYGKNIVQYTSEIAESVGAIFAINGDYYGIRNGGYVIRNGVVYRENKYTNSQEDLVIYPDGSMGIVYEKDVTAQELYDEGAWQVFSFGPALVDGGEISVDNSSEVANHMVSNPRTAIGIIDELHYVFIVSDGRTSESKGLSLVQLGELMIDLGVVTGYNLDGGGSSSMVFNGKVINKPTTSGGVIKERGISDIVYIGI